MASLEDLEDLERENKDDKKDEGDKDKKITPNGDAEMKDVEEKKEEEDEDVLDEEILTLSTRDIIARRRLLENDARIMKSEYQRLNHEKSAMHEKIKDNLDKIENNRSANTLPTITHRLVMRYEANMAFPLHKLILLTGNYPTSSAMSSRFSIWM